MHTRIITCQGSTQLLAAMAALACRERADGDAWKDDQNILVIYDLYTPEFHAFDAVIRRLAIRLLNWSAIVTITPQQVNRLQSLVRRQRVQKAMRAVYDLLGVSSADSIFVVRNWQFGNQLLLNAYSSAEKVCYGDGLGIFSSRPHEAVHFVRPWHRHLRRSIRKRLRNAMAVIGGVLRSSNWPRGLSDISFDVGYFCAIEAPPYEGKPDMQWHYTDQQYYLNILNDWKAVIDRRFIEEIRAFCSGGCFVMLGENLSECGAATREHEFSAYREVLQQERISGDTPILFKPHPRDSAEKTHELRNTLQESGFRLRVLDQPELAYLPFELLYLTLFVDKTHAPSCDVRVRTFSFTALSLQYLFRADSSFGFGAKLISKYFNAEHISRAVEFEEYVGKEMRRRTLLGKTA